MGSSHNYFHRIFKPGKSGSHIWIKTSRGFPEKWSALYYFHKIIQPWNNSAWNIQIYNLRPAEKKRQNHRNSYSLCQQDISKKGHFSILMLRTNRKRKRRPNKLSVSDGGLTLTDGARRRGRRRGKRKERKERGSRSGERGSSVVVGVKAPAPELRGCLFESRPVIFAIVGAQNKSYAKRLN